MPLALLYRLRAVRQVDANDEESQANGRRLLEGAQMTGSRKLPPFEQSLAAIMLSAKESVIAPMRPILREHNTTEPQWRVMRVLNDRGATDASCLSDVGLLHAPSVTRILK